MLQIERAKEYVVESIGRPLLGAASETTEEN